MVLVSSYSNLNQEDVLIVQLAPAVSKTVIDSSGPVVRIQDQEGKTLGFNFFQQGQALGLSESGPVQLNEDQIQRLNEQLEKESFDDRLSVDLEPKFVIGHVLESKKMEDSDHLKVTQTQVGLDDSLQIVCGAPNVKAGQKVVVAKEGAIMPDGSVIWNGSLRGVESQGMICSAKELGLEQAPKRRGILVLDDDAEVGQAFTTNI